MNAVSPIPAQAQSSPTNSAPPRKLLQAAQQFEALLLNTLLGPMEKTFSSLPGQKDVPGSDNYAYLGTQAFATAIAASGGIGIARMIIHNVMIHNLVKPDPIAKVLSGKADGLR